MDYRKCKEALYLRGIIILLLLVAGIPAGTGKTSAAQDPPEATHANQAPAELPQSNYSEDLGNGIRLDMIWIPAGTFLMGSPKSEKGRKDDEGPQAEVSLEGYWIGKYEVTQAQYKAVIGTNPSFFTGDNQPVESVSWNDTMKFCRKLSEKTGKHYILPTEAQWEYSCRAGTTTPYSFGDDAKQLGDYAWWSDNSPLSAHPVGQKKPNAWGLYDMHGNIDEWCLSSYMPYPYSETDGRNSLVDASGLRVLHGGSWMSSAPDIFRCAYRFTALPPEGRLLSIGFRCARTP